MTDSDKTKGPAGTTRDPNQADRTGLPDHPDETKPVVHLDVPDAENTDQPTGPGTTYDPNQADRTVRKNKS